MAEHKHQISFTEKLFTAHLQFRFVYRFLFFVIGLSLGITSTLYFRSSFSNTGIISDLLSLPSSLLPLPQPASPSPEPSKTVETISNTSLISKVKQNGVHAIDDAELFWRASMVPLMQEFSLERVPKVAFMFLTKGDIPLAPLWERFFSGHDGFYSIYIHADPNYNQSMPKDSVFHGRRIPSKVVEWGKPTMTDAERRLLANALLDFSNERFVLLSETCIPLFNFTTVYNHLIKSDGSYVASYDDPRKVGRGRYNKQMWPTISISEWRKGSQWFEVNRKLAIEIISDRKYYPLFVEYCRPPCYPDEHYIPTLVNILSPEQNENRSITWVDWSKNGPHPARFNRQSVTADFLNQIRSVSNCTFQNGNTTSICFLFARKFVPDTIQALLQLVPLLFDT